MQRILGIRHRIKESRTPYHFSLSQRCTVSYDHPSDRKIGAREENPETVETLSQYGNDLWNHQPRGLAFLPEGTYKQRLAATANPPFATRLEAETKLTTGKDGRPALAARRKAVQ